MMKEISCVCDLEELVIEKAPLLLVDVISSNRNYYPKEEVIKAIEFYNKLCDKVDPTYRYMLIRHPKITDRNEFDNGLKLDISDISYEKVAGWLERVYYDENDNIVYGDVKVLNTKNGLIIRYLYEKGFPIGFSVRLAYSESEEAVDENHQKYYIKRGLLINGWDFTLNPSFVFTWIKKDMSGSDIIREIKLKELSNKSNVKDVDLLVDERNIEAELKTKFNVSIEQVKELSKEIYSIIKEMEVNSEIEKIANNKKNIKNKNNTKEVSMEVEKDLEKIVFEKKLELERISINKEKLELEVKKLEQLKSQLEVDINKLSDELNEKHNKISELNKNIESKESELLVIINKLEKYKANVESLNRTIEEYNEKITELKNEIDKLEELKKSVEATVLKDVVVKYKDKEFSLSNPPKIKMSMEKISEREWGEVDKTELRKLLYLTQDEKLIREAFAIVEDIKDYSTYKYPHHELIESEDKDYDFEMVLNLNGLRTALIFATGFAGKHLSKEEKKKLGEHLLYHYEYLKNEKVIDEIPSSVYELVGKGKGLEIVLRDEELDEIREDDRIILEKSFDLLKSLLDNKIIEIDGFEDYETLEVSPELMSKIVSVMSKEFIYYLHNSFVDMERDVNIEQNMGENEVENPEELIEYVLDALRYYYDYSDKGKTAIDEIGINITDVDAFKQFITDVYNQNVMENIMKIYNVIREAIVFKEMNEEFMDLDNPMDFVKKVEKANKIVVELHRYFSGMREQQGEQKTETKEETELEPVKDYEILDKEDMPEVREKLLRETMGEKQSEDVNIDVFKENLINKAIIKILINKKATEDDVTKFLELVESDVKDKEEITIEELKGIIDKNLKIILERLDNSDNIEYSAEMEIERKGKAVVETTLPNITKYSLFDKLLNE